MAETGLEALVMASGTSLVYFTGAEWGLSERFFGAVLFREGEPAWVVPAFEKARGLEQIRMGTDVRVWEEDESPSALVASLLREKGVTRVGIEETMPFAFAHGIGQAAPAARLESATPVTAGCRRIKDAHEIALMRRAGEITMEAHRAVFQSLREGVTQAEVAGWSALAHRRLGVRGGSLVLFGQDAAFPHGTTSPQPLKAGEFVLIDGGCKRARLRERHHAHRHLRRAAHASGSAASGTWCGRPRKPRSGPRGRGCPCQAVDAAARKVIDDAGFGPGYRTFTHRVGHGIGMDGHEWTYLVKGNETPLEPGMCFSDEPGIYIPGEIGVRHEDVIFITPEGAENLTKWTGSPEEPAVL